MNRVFQGARYRHKLTQVTCDISYRRWPTLRHDRDGSMVGENTRR